MLIHAPENIIALMTRNQWPFVINASQKRPNKALVTTTFGLSNTFPSITDSDLVNWNTSYSCASNTPLTGARENKSASHIGFHRFRAVSGSSVLSTLMWMFVIHPCQSNGSNHTRESQVLLGFQVGCVCVCVCLSECASVSVGGWVGGWVERGQWLFNDSSVSWSVHNLWR